MDLGTQKRRGSSSITRSQWFPNHRPLIVRVFKLGLYGNRDILVEMKNDLIRAYSDLNDLTSHQKIEIRIAFQPVHRQFPSTWQLKTATLGEYKHPLWVTG